MLYTPEWDLGLGALVGLLLGSFLNVLIHRLPKMLELQWDAECATVSGRPASLQPAYNLWVPRSTCTHCAHTLRWHENLPVLSFLWLRGRCSACGTRISLHYPLVELVTSALFAAAFWRWGATDPTAWAWCLFCAFLVALAVIDWNTTLLPDNLTLTLLWAGLGAAALGLTGTPLVDAFWGAVAGYLSLWLVFWSFKLITGKDGMGYGDFKLFAALGAWFGWQALVPMILMASVLGALVGLTLRFFNHLREEGYVPFGPFLSLAGLTALWLTPAKMLELVGL